MIRWRIVVGGRELAPVGLSGSVLWGRDDIDSQPDASTCSVTFLDPAGTVATSTRIGDPFDLIAYAGGADRRRFSGSVVDVRIDRENRETTIAAAGPLSNLARTRIGATPWPAELEGDRILRILGLAGVDVADPTRWVDVAPGVMWRWTPESWRAVGHAQPSLTWAAATGDWTAAGGLDGGAMHPDGSTIAATWRELRGPDVPDGELVVRARDVDAKPAPELLRETASSVFGVILERRDGTIAFQPRTARTRALDVDTDAAAFLTTTVFTLTTEGVVNALDVASTADGGYTFTVANAGSSKRLGQFQRSWSTDLDAEGDARLLAEQYVARRSVPAWRFDSLVFDSDVATDTVTAALMGIELGDTLRVSRIGPPTPTASMLVVVEGARETIEPDRWVAELACSDARLSMLGGSWAEHGAADPGRVWATVPDALLWPTADDLLPIVTA